MEAKFLAWNLFKLAPIWQFGFSRLGLDGNKLAKDICLARKMRDKEVFIWWYRGSSIFQFLIKLVSKG